jgi:hypothetical protein
MAVGARGAMEQGASGRAKRSRVCVPRAETRRLWRFELGVRQSLLPRLARAPGAMHWSAPSMPGPRGGGGVQAGPARGRP